MRLSIIIPVYYNEENLRPLYSDIKKKVIDAIDYEYEIVMVDDGSGDGSYDVMRQLAAEDSNIRIARLSRNFGSHSAMLCGLERCTGDCAVIKAADLQEPSEMILEMVEKWRHGDNVVLAVREGREEGRSQVMFANLYYWIARKSAFPNMPKKGFDVYLIDRKVIRVLLELDERNSALTGQILWSGFRTGYVGYVRQARDVGESRWTLKKKVRLVADTLFSFSSLPVAAIEAVGALSFLGAVIWAALVLALKATGSIQVEGWTSLFIFSLFSFGVTMVTMGILGEYLWRTFEASRNRPPYIVEDEGGQEPCGKE
ncbi:glycosyltransferase [Clostridiaceae bacterium]|nr:glycosyltransferase [Clostridiaceae bacterium]RKI13555.1 glycosyltransferase [bacterium 1XD21-70]